MNQSNSEKVKWYFSIKFFLIALLSIGPLAMPLIWFHPRYKMITKVTLTMIVLGLTVWSYFILKEQYLRLTEQLTELGLY